MAATRRDALIDMIPQLIERIERLEGAKKKKYNAGGNEIFGWVVTVPGYPGWPYGFMGYYPKDLDKTVVFDTKRDAELIIRLKRLDGAEVSLVYRDTLEDAF